MRSSNDQLARALLFRTLGLVEGPGESLGLMPAPVLLVDDGAAAAPVNVLTRLRHAVQAIGLEAGEEWQIEASLVPGSGYAAFGDPIDADGIVQLPSDVVVGYLRAVRADAPEPAVAASLEIVIGDSTITVEAVEAGEPGNGLAVEFVIGEGVDDPLSAALVGTLITVTLGTLDNCPPVAGVPDDAKNTATLIAAAIDGVLDDGCPAAPVVTAGVTDGDGNDALDEARESASLEGGAPPTLTPSTARLILASAR